MWKILLDLLQQDKRVKEYFPEFPAHSTETFKATLSSLQGIQKQFNLVGENLQSRTITTKVNDKKYVTTITLDGDITNEFLSEIKSDDEAWKFHQKMVDEYFEMRKKVTEEVIKMSGDTVKGIINPISSMVMTPADVMKILGSSKA